MEGEPQNAEYNASLHDFPLNAYILAKYVFAFASNVGVVKAVGMLQSLIVSTLTFGELPVKETPVEITDGAPFPVVTINEGRFPSWERNVTHHFLPCRVRGEIVLWCMLLVGRRVSR